MRDTKIRTLAKTLVSDTASTANFEYHLTPGQIDIKLYTKGLCKSVPFSQYIMSAFNYKKKKIRRKAKGEKVLKI